MTLAQGISKHGFRSWYERELVVCHSYLVTSLLCLILVLLLLENLDWRESWPGLLLKLAAVVAATLTGGGALQRYLHILGGVLALGQKCVCAQCHAYGIVQVVADGSTAHDAESQWLRLRCGKCGHLWQVTSRLK